MKRVVIPELLDTDSGTAAEIAASLADLRRINRWFGGISTTCDLVERVARTAGRRELTLLDVAAGSGDVARATGERLAAKGIRLRVTLVDRARSHLNGNGVAADALALPFADSSFDLVTCSLFLHHLEPPEIARFVNEALRVARVAVLINDLRRSAVSLALVYAGFPLFRSPITRHDGPASVRRAYTIKEMSDLLARSGARIELFPHFLYRMGAIAWKQRSADDAMGR